jgi:crotonobetainyl-CoA:carnitine CoA-transferase CaiB-like acyl-CoA transferase
MGLATELDDPRTGPILSTGSALRWDGTRTEAQFAPFLGQDTELVLADWLGLSTREIGRLVDERVIVLGGPVARE